MSEFWTYALETPASHLNAGWFWLLPLLFAIHDAEEAAFVWMKGSFHNSISYSTLDVPQMLVAISFELAILMAASPWGAGAGRVASSDLYIRRAVGRLCGARSCQLYLGWRAHGYTLGVATALPFVVFGGCIIYAKLIETGTLSWTWAATSFVPGALVMLPLIRAARWVGLTFA